MNVSVNDHQNISIVGTGFVLGVREAFVLACTCTFSIYHLVVYKMTTLAAENMALIIYVIIFQFTVNHY